MYTWNPNYSCLGQLTSPPVMWLPGNPLVPDEETEPFQHPYSYLVSGTPELILENKQ